MQDPIEEFLADVRESKSEGTYETRKSHMKAYDAYLNERGLDATEMGKKDVHRFLRRESDKYADATVDARYWSLSTLYDYLEKWDEIGESPMEDLAPKDYTGNGKSKHTEADMVYVTSDEVDQMAENVTDPQLRNELIVRLLFQTGVRRDELRNMKLEDIDRDERKIVVQDSKDPEKQRPVKYQPSLDFLMNQWIDVYRDNYVTAPDSPYLFLTSRSDQLGASRLREIIHQAAEEAGIQETLYEDAAGNKRYRVTPHALRHGHAIEAIKSGIDIRRLQKHMGHDKLETTMRYLQFIDEDVMAAMQKFGTRPESEEAA